jgi:hypothetical protein
MEHLAFLMSHRCFFVDRFRFDASHERGNRNGILAMKTYDATVRLLHFLLGHAEPRS